MPTPLPAAHVEHHRRRRTARVVTAVALVLTGLRVRRLVLTALADDPSARAVGAWYFFLAGLEVVALGALVVWAWRRSYAARAAVLPVAESSRAASGDPEQHGPQDGRHVGLSQAAEPPRRW